ncbi:hypothetical protein GCM10007394_18300 [Salinibacterium amurskyense]|nr:hypothetical protein GCM10007394_18300 [Salinibacterium amurskyense]
MADDEDSHVIKGRFESPQYGIRFGEPVVAGDGLGVKKCLNSIQLCP